MFSAVAPVGGSRRASGCLGARRAPSPSVSLRCVLPMAVNPAISVFATPSGAAYWTQRGSCARRGCGLALPAMTAGREPTPDAVASRSSCPSENSRSRACHQSSSIAFAVDHGPNPAVNTDAHRRGFARAVVAGYLTRWASLVAAAYNHHFRSTGREI